MLGATIVSTLAVVIPMSNDWIILTPTCYLRVSTIALLTLLVELCWLKINDVLVCCYPLVSSMVQNVDVNAPLVFYS
jgi:hypothetical protein